MLTIRPARPSDAETLSALAFRSKACWGYTAEFMEACRAELTYAAKELRSDRFQFAVGEQSGVCVGFYAVEKTAEDEAELVALFVEPAHIGKGCGRMLMEHAKRVAGALGASRMIVQGDPNAERFYLAAGGHLIGTRESASIEGRFLPLYAIELDTERGE